MNGFILLIALGVAALGLLWLTGLRGSLWTLAAAALLFGGAGYALQGRPELPGSTAAGLTAAPPIPLTGARHAFLGRFNQADRWVTISESFASRGKTQDAVGILQSAIREHPDDFALWVGLGNALTDHARMITPAAELAYARAEELAPWSPAPGFFRGLALMRSGEREAALAEWRTVLANAPANASWRPIVEDGVALLERAPPAR
jgi:cytochrome c-type biogenesis protein CcmH